MAFCSVQFRAAALEKQSSMYVILPDGPGPFPVLYLLHGLSDDHTIWARRTSIERYAEGQPLIVVMPDGHRSWYVNDPRPAGGPYEDHIVQDVVGFIDRTFPTIAGRQGRAVAGLSMGGYGATMLAMRHPDMFCAASSHSGALGMFHIPIQDRPDILAMAEAVGGKSYDCFRLAKVMKASRQKLALRIDCGLEDFLLPHNRLFHAHLEKLGLPHIYAEYPGAHTWAYWDLHVQETIRFVLENVRKPSV